MVALLSEQHFLAWRPFCIDAFSSRIPFTTKTPDTIGKAIRMPELASDEYSLEIAGREGDRPIHESPGEGSRCVNPSECWHFVYRTG
jgi:hypothetical protein